MFEDFDVTLKCEDIVDWYDYEMYYNEELNEVPIEKEMP
jgi:hypothetical protein